MPMKYLHTMVRVADIAKSLDFYCGKLGMEEVRRIENEAGRFTLIFLAAPDDKKQDQQQSQQSQQPQKDQQPQNQPAQAQANQADQKPEDKDDAGGRLTNGPQKLNLNLGDGRIG